MTWITTEDGVPIVTEDTGAILVTESLHGAPTRPLLVIIPSYPYEQYADDPNIVAFFTAFNSITQTYLDWFNDTPLPVYTSPNINGQLLDWVGRGIYGIDRPVFSSLTTKYRAGVNSRSINTAAVNGKIYSQSGTATVANDDFYKRTLTWWNYLGNTRYFNVQNLRWKVARFLYGPNGTDITLTQAQKVHIQAGMVPSSPAPTLSAVPGGSITSRTYSSRLTYVTPVGETLAGLTSSLTVADNELLSAASPPSANGVTGYNVYAAITDATPGKFIAGVNAYATNQYPVNGSNNRAPTPMFRQNTQPIAIGTAWTEPSSGLIVSEEIPTSDTSNTPTNLIITVPSGQASQYLQQALNQGLLAYPLQLTSSVVIAA